MNANELRIGNWVQRPDELNKPPIEGKKYWVVDIGMIRDCFHYKEFWAFEPIPLTEEILLKCGFENKKYKIDVFEKGRIRVWIGSRGQYLVYLIEEDTTTAHYICSIEYVHTFQNLIFALTQTELEINL